MQKWVFRADCTWQNSPKWSPENEYLALKANLCGPSPLPRVNLSEPLIELALAGNCRKIVTNNVKDLAAAELKFDELRILKPEQILRGE
jgi:hypothetical protein